MPQDNDSWQMQWELYTPLENYEWSTGAQSIEEAINIAVHSLADFMYAQQAELDSKTDSKTTTLIIDNIYSFAEQESLMKTLKSKNSIQNVEIVEQNHQSVRIIIQHDIPLEKILATTPQLSEQQQSKFEDIRTENHLQWHPNEIASTYETVQPTL